MKKKEISEYMRMLARRSHKKSPRSREHFVKMARLSAEKRRRVIPSLTLDVRHAID